MFDQLKFLCTSSSNASEINVNYCTVENTIHHIQNSNIDFIVSFENSKGFKKLQQFFK